MPFLQLDLNQPIHAAKTIWLFRKTLAHAQVVETLFGQIDACLVAHGLQLYGGQMFDASLVFVCKVRHTYKENAKI